MAQTPHRSTSRVLDIFDLLSTTMEGFTLTEIAQALQSPKSSILPILQTMAARNYIDLDYRTNRYTIGINLFCVGWIYHTKFRSMNPRDWECGSCPIPRRKPTAGDLNEVKERLKNRKPPRASACFEQGGCTERFRGCGRREVQTAWQRNPLMKTAPGG